MASLFTIVPLLSGTHAPSHLDGTRVPAASTLLLLGAALLGAWVVGWLLHRD
jgi:hypothetical protein